MGGPSASVLLSAPLSEADYDDIFEVILRIGSAQVPFQLSNLDFKVVSTQSIQGSYCGKEQPFGLSVGLLPERNETEMPAIERTLQTRIFDEILVSSHGNDRECHRILGELCLWFAERFAGFIDFCGAITPPLLPGSGLDWDSPWLDWEPHVRTMIQGMPGQFFEIWHDGCDPRTFHPAHFCDATFLRAWLQHPQFQMVK